MIRLYLDEHIPSAIADALRVRRADVLTVQEDGRSGCADEEILERATELGRVVFTFDDDYLRVMAEATAQGRNFSGVIYARAAHVGIGRCVADLELICLAGEPEDLAGRIERIPLK